MYSDDLLAYFITWTVYGSHLQCDESGWRRRGEGFQAPEPRLYAWRQERLNYPVQLLNAEHRAVVAAACQRHCDHRGWRLWAVNARSNHVHAVVTAVSHFGKVVLDQLKANCTRFLREGYPVFRERPVWSVGGDWDCINSEDDLETVCQYVLEAQDRMDRKS